MQDSMVRQETEVFGKDLDLVHEAVVTGRKVGVGREFWSRLSHDQLLFAEVVKSLELPVALVIDQSQFPKRVVDRYKVDTHPELEFYEVLKLSNLTNYEEDILRHKESSKESALISHTSTIRLYRFLKEVDEIEAQEILYKPFNVRPAVPRELICLSHQYFRAVHPKIHAIASHYPLRVSRGLSETNFALYRREPGYQQMELYPQGYRWPRHNLFACVEL